MLETLDSTDGTRSRCLRILCQNLDDEFRPSCQSRSAGDVPVSKTEKTLKSHVVSDNSELKRLYEISQFTKFHDPNSRKFESGINIRIERDSARRKAGEQKLKEETTEGGYSERVMPRAFMREARVEGFMPSS